MSILVIPSLSVRSFAELLRLPAYEHVRILTEQKYPKQGPQRFRVPFYRHSMDTIRRYYATGRQADVLQAARSAVSRLNPEAKRMHNLRIIEQFAASPQSHRPITVQAPATLYATPGHEVRLRLQFDLVGQEAGVDRYIFYNFREVPLDEETARLALEVSAWVLAQNGVQSSPSSLQFVDLTSDHVHSLPSRPRARTIQAMQRNAQVVAALWQGI